MTRDDLETFRRLEIDFESIGLMEPGVAQEPHFCTPEGAEFVGRLGCDGVHFVLLPGDERVFCVDPSMGEPGTYVLPVAPDMRTFVSYLLYCRSANPLSQIAWLAEAPFRALLAEDAQADGPGEGEKRQALDALAAAFQAVPADPFQPVKALQRGFDPSQLTFSDEYYDVLGLERPGGEG